MTGITLDILFGVFLVRQLALDILCVSVIQIRTFIEHAFFVAVVHAPAKHHNKKSYRNFKTVCKDKTEIYIFQSVLLRDQGGVCFVFCRI